jgi:hypothetical protein
MRTARIFVALCLLPMGIATAQSSSPHWPLDSGSRVRIQAPIFSDQTQQGTVTSTRADTLRFRAWGDTASTAVGVKDISRIDVFQGTHSRKTRGTVIGFAIGAGLAAGITAATWKKPTNGCGLCMDFGRGGDAALLALPGGVIGGLVGFLVGAQQRDTWLPVKLPNR